jgi:D-beta-D-heptose 7-phosphate kinase/D-beta-D-heptose 1-phosphate adenosyltransferase
LELPVLSGTKYLTEKEMQSNTYSKHKIQKLHTLLPLLEMLRFKQKKIVFTNGCFDIIHPGHLQTLNAAAALGNYLVVGVNSDDSVKRLKGLTRPVQNQESRLCVLANLMVVDAVLLFEEDTPLSLIKAILPDVLVKGGDYDAAQVVGAQEVLANGGLVTIIPFLEGFSTTSIIDLLKT